MTGAFVLAILLSAPAPAPATPPPQIIEVRSRALCTTLRENVRIALAGLMKNDAVIEAGGKAYRKMAADQMAQAKGSVGMDRLFVENAVGAIVHNLAEIDALLDDPRRFPIAAASTDTRNAVAMKAQLQAIADQQKRTLNVLNGVLETDNLQDMQSFGDLDVAPPSVGPATDGPVGNAPATGGRITATSPGAVDVRNFANDGLIGSSLYGQVAQEVATQQSQAQQLESKAAITIMNVAAECSGAKP
jgi:hypothetical protein